MQTFLPYSSFTLSAACLDNKRLGKQRVEAYQIIRAINDPTSGWAGHPATKMWKGYLPALKAYYNVTILQWVLRGFRNNMICAVEDSEIILPPWFGDNDFHAAHRSNLLQKDPIHYGKFGWSESPDLPYIWPVI